MMMNDVKINMTIKYHDDLSIVFNLFSLGTHVDDPLTLRTTIHNDYGIQVMPTGLGTIYSRSLQPDNGRCHAATGIIVGRCVLIKIQAITSGKTPLRVRRTSYYFALNAVGARQTGTCVRVYKFIAI